MGCQPPLIPHLGGPLISPLIPPFPGPLALEKSAVRTPEDVARMVPSQALGWGVQRIAPELGSARNSAKTFLRTGEWRPSAPRLPSALGHDRAGSLRSCVHPRLLASVQH